MTKEEILQKINELKDKKHSLEMERDAFDARQMSLKVLLNSAYGSLSLHANTFAGNAEYFSLSITSSGRIANRFITEEQSREIDRLSGCETLDNLANVSQVDTDSMYLNLSKIVTKKFGNNEVDRMEVIEFLDKYMEKIAQKLVRERLDNILSYTFNSYLPQKLMMDREIIADCLPFTSKVMTDKGLRDIGMVCKNPNDYLVLSLSKEGKEEFKKVINTKKSKRKRKMIKLIFPNGKELICTPNHKIAYLENGEIKYKEAFMISEYDDIIERT